MVRTLALALITLLSFALNSPAEQPPNIIYVLADDLGYGDIACYGQPTLTTPNIDRLANEGIRFTRHYAGSTVCAPSRCVLMTGLHTGHCRIRGNGPGQLQSTDVTIATRLKLAGYKTGAFGKWGIGNPPPLDDPQRHGFDEFYGYVNMFHAHNYYPEFLVHNGKKVPLRNRLYADWKAKETPPREGGGVAALAIDYAPALIADRALEFVREHHEGPFFLYYALNLPHANNEGGRDARIDHNGMRVPDLGSFQDREWPIQEKGFARMIESIDDDVGRILSLLAELGIDEKTVVMFSSDNGPHQEGGHKVDFFDSNGPLRGWKRDLYDGGIRVPFLVRWPGTIGAGLVSDHLSAFQDVFPTLSEIAGLPQLDNIDGISFVPTLRGQTDRQPSHAHLYWEFLEQGGKQAVIKDHWKAIRLNTLKNSNAATLLFDLDSDPTEQQNVAAEHESLIQDLDRLFAQEHRD